MLRRFGFKEIKRVCPSSVSRIADVTMGKKSFFMAEA
jgi:hypothetical protein